MIKTFFSNIFSIRDIDSHYIIIFFTIQIKIRHKHNKICPQVLSKGITDVKRNIPIIVSLTSFPQRINAVVSVIKTLLCQTLKPDEVILWLAKEQFLNTDKDLPKELTELTKYGLSIKWCSDIRSYKKLVPSLKENPDAIIITADDDIYYAPDTVESLYKSYLRYPNEIHAHRSARIKIQNNGFKNIPGKMLYTKKYSNPSFLNRLTGCGAVLYPPHCFYKDIVNDKIFMKILPTHDDVWFWAMGALNNYKVRIVKGFKDSLYFVENTQETGLCKINTESRGISMDEAYRRILNQYPELMAIAEND